MPASTTPLPRQRRPLANLRSVTNPPKRRSSRVTPRAGLDAAATTGPSSTAVPNSRSCPRCQSVDILEEDGVTVCRNCFTQINDANIVADVTFEEQAGGRSTVQGGFVSDTARHAKTLGPGAYRKVGGGQRNSLAEIESTGRRALANLTPKLGIPDTVAQQANSIWALAANINFSAGRRTDEVVAACLYAACRRQKRNEILLMDISELLKISVFRLGEVYKDLCRELYLANESVGVQNLIELEPLIWKYCNKLQFNEKTREVATDALRIIKRMNRDWIVSGRHPAGLCGASIILAARMNNFRRSVREVVYVSKVADITIAKRVEEFRRTKAASLTVQEFREYGNRMKFQHNPPSLDLADRRQELMAKKKRKRDEYMLSQSAQTTPQPTPAIEISDDGSEASSRDPSVEIAEPEIPRKRQRMMGSSTKLRTPSPTQQKQQPKKTHQEKQQNPSGQERRYDADGFAIPALPLQSLPVAQDKGKKRGRPKKTDLPPTVIISEEELAEEDYLEKEIESVLEKDEIIDSRNEVEKAKDEERAHLLSIQQQQIAAQQNQDRRQAEGHPIGGGSGSSSGGEPPLLTTSPDPSNSDDLDLEREFENDPEVLNCRLSAEEVKVKEQIWVAHNEDWLRKQAEKEILLRIARATGGGGGGSDGKRKRNGAGNGKRRKRSKMGDGTVLTEHSTPIESPADAAKAMLEKRAPQKSMHVDFSALERIYGRTTPSSRSATPSTTRDQTPASEVDEGSSAGEEEVEEDDNEDDDDDDGENNNNDDNDTRSLNRANANIYSGVSTIPMRPPTWEDIANEPEDGVDDDADEDIEAEEDDYRAALRMDMPSVRMDEFGEVDDGGFEDDEGEEYE